MNETVETGWLIELQTNDGAKWWTAADPMFTRDSWQAVRFSRREDAERVIGMFRDINDHQFWDEAYATDHMWILGEP